MKVSDSQVLDNPVWEALTSVHTHLGVGEGDARVYLPDVSPFAGLRSMDTNAMHCLKASLEPGASAVVLVATNTLPDVAGLTLAPLFKIQQMVETRPPASEPRVQPVRLSERDVPEMFELAQRTQPGPFASRTAEMGNYIGVRQEGRLVAMAGERFRLKGFTEISAVCVDEKYRGRGIASDLIHHLRKEISGRGEVAFLHVREDSQATIALYQHLGFSTRAVFQLYRVCRTA